MIKYIEKVASKSLPQAGEVAKEIVKDIIWKKLYQEYNPENYTRTYQFINSVRVGNIKQTSNGYTVPIYYDTSLIHPLETLSDEWNIHMNLYGGSESYALPYYLEQDNPGGAWRPREGIGAMQSVIDGDYNAHIRILQEIVLALEKKGFVVAIEGK